MSQKQENEGPELEIVPLDVPLDADTIAWLARLVRTTGSAPAEIVASMLRDIRIDDEAADGDAFAAGAVIAELRGPLAAILAAERTALNFLCRLSGVATLTAIFAAETAGTGARIAARRLLNASSFALALSTSDRLTA